MDKKKIDVKNLTTLALLTAVQIVLSRLFSIRLPFATIGFGFLPSTIAGILFGRWQAMAVSGAADLLGALAFPIGPFFPGYTFTALISGYIRGAGFYQKDLNIKNISFVVVLNQTITSLFLNTLWIFLVNGQKNFLPILVGRILAVAVNAFAQIFITYFFSKKVLSSVKIKTP